MRKLFAILLILTVVAQADTKRFQNQVNIRDSQIRGAAANNNYGTSPTLTAGNYPPYRGLISFVLLPESLGTAKAMLSGLCSLWVSTSSAAATDTIWVGHTWKPFFEGDKANATADTFDCSWNDFFAADSEWNDAGADSASDAADYNAEDGFKADRTVTPFDTIFFTSATTGWVTFDIPASLMQSFYDGNRFGILLYQTFPPNTTCNISYSSKENTTTGNRPILWVTYSTAGSGEASSILKKKKALLIQGTE